MTLMYRCSILCLLCALPAAGCRKAASYEKPLTPVKIKAVEQQAFSGGTVRYSANIQPNQQIDLAFKIGGIVRDVMTVRGQAVQEGEWIEKGAVLARLRDDEIGARVKQANALLAEASAAQTTVRAQLAEAQVAQDQLKRELERATRLLEADALIKPDFESVKARFEMGQARIESIKSQLSMTQAKADGARAGIEEAESARSDCELRAPISGVLLRRTIEPGGFVAPGAPAFTLGDLFSIKAVFGVPDVAAMQLKPGTALTVASEAIRDIEFRGRLTRIAPAADARTRVFDVEAVIPNPRRLLRAGMVVSLQLSGERPTESVTVVPLNALFQLKEKDGGYALFVLAEKDGKSIAHLRRVSPGRTLGNLIEIPSGVALGEQVVVSGATLISDNEQVRIVQ
ncbi:MAG: efflux RND transporter periplasmic adaptor subunit [Blastocatellia bacterium]|nr:efflux RND transporter periplasmic adaptor subunit [Blastocatellia bacterium]